MRWVLKMRKEVRELLNLGPMPNESVVDEETVTQYESLLHRIQPPLTSKDAENLISLFGNDTFYGLAWTMLDLIESASYVKLPESNNEWVGILKTRFENLHQRCSRE